MKTSRDILGTGFEVFLDDFLSAFNRLNDNEKNIIMIRFGMVIGKPFSEWNPISTEHTANICDKPVEQVRQVEGKMVRFLSHPSRD